MVEKNSAGRKYIPRNSRASMILQTIMMDRVISNAVWLGESSDIYGNEDRTYIGKNQGRREESEVKELRSGRSYDIYDAIGIDE